MQLLFREVVVSTLSQDIGVSLHGSIAGSQQRFGLRFPCLLCRPSHNLTNVWHAVVADAVEHCVEGRGVRNESKEGDDLGIFAQIFLSLRRGKDTRTSENRGEL